ncbi:hypothetical protein [Streptomyces sp. VRA16 Mangrove soil]|uniref:hypothetical protein n=1 Tax=Streptomyces sp. VRA16 Mangrove soil TaxID=2817434 RepID=UPI001A9EAB42|nr:hypothetical protein [Streptomyces sp. VRA16 Mangrove soil]MBO1332826.1 hypothetical protein [Streptomyces sp. VRA16 Mangrove soil]
MPRSVAFHDFGALGFDGAAAFEAGAVDRIREAVRDSGVRELYVLAHGAHNDDAMSRTVDGAYRELLADAWSDAPGEAGVLGVHWPSLCFRDEGLPGADQPDESHGVGADTADDLLRRLPDRADALHEIIGLLHDRPDYEPALDDLGTALRRLAELPLQDPVAAFAADTMGEILPQSDPLMLFEDTRTVCAEFAGALDDLRRARGTHHGRPARHASGTEGPEASEGGTLPEARIAGPRPARPLSDRVGRAGTVAAGGPLGEQARAADFGDLWNGAHELFRQVVRHVLRRRAGFVGQYGLGRCLPQLAEGNGVRLHLVGHGLGGRLAGFALRGLENGDAEPVLLSSLTLLQAEMSHFAFADSLPQQVSGHGALWSLQRLVAGPLLCTFSHLDSHLGVMYPLSAQMIGDSAELVSLGRKWGALGFDGLQGVEGPAPATLKGLPELDLHHATPYLNIDVSEVVSSPDLPLGGHHDVFHPEIGRLLRRASGRRRGFKDRL